LRSSVATTRKGDAQMAVLAMLEIDGDKPELNTEDPGE
jgi:hypothetical protein